ncbi:MAG: alkene reductase [Gammaproteobacteria bacterium]|nr:alkene reductase [Gammaproteobacteria bacterium]
MSTGLFTPLKMGPLELPNRIVMAPLTRNRAPGCVPNSLMAEYYRQRASVGLIVTEASQVSPQGVGYPATPGIHSPEQTEAWKAVTGAVHEAGGRIFLQLWHVGRISHPSYHDGILTVAPSAIAPKGEAVTYQGMQPFVKPRALEIEEIPGIVEDFRRAAANARAAGFDGVEIHGANGYLIDQFLRDGSNRRSDEYGGSIENRARLLLEVTEAVAGEWIDGCVGVRLSPWQPFNDMADSDPQATFSYAVQALAGYKLAYLHLTEMGRDAPGAAGPDFEPNVLREAWPGVLITNGGYDRARADDAIAEGAADAVAFGQLCLANPDLPQRLRTGAPLNTPDPATFYGGDAHGYTDYPVLATS